MVERQAQAARRQHPGSLRPRRLADLGLPGPSRPQARLLLRPHPRPLDTLDKAAGDDGPLTITDTGYEAAPEGFRVPHKKPQGSELTVDQKQFNKVIRAICALPRRPTPS
ncbi:hypothetical protein GCM10022206_74010 [Streptomyces chiangmaiensis]